MTRRCPSTFERPRPFGLVLALLAAGLATSLPAAPSGALVSATVSGLASGNQRSDTTDGQQVSHRLVSFDGRYVCFQSQASNLTSLPDANDAADIFLRDLSTGVTTLVSVNQAGTAAGNGPCREATLSKDGRFVCFVSSATDLTPGVADHVENVYVRDLQERKTVLVSATPAGAGGNGYSLDPVMTPDGHFVAFTSVASNLVAGVQEVPNGSDIFERDLEAANPQTATELVSVIPNQPQPTAAQACLGQTAISADGRYVAFTTYTALVNIDVNSATDIYVRDRALKTTELVSINAAGSLSGAFGSQDPVISADGRYVAFVSESANLVNVLTAHVITFHPGQVDVFVRDRTSRTTTLVSINPAGTADGNGGSSNAAMSADGRYVAFYSLATDLVGGVADRNAFLDVFVRDLQTRTTVLASVNSTGTATVLGRVTPPVLSDDGRYVVFSSDAPDVVSGDANGVYDVFRRDLIGKKTELVSRTPTATSGNGDSGVTPTEISGDGSVVFFASNASDLDSHDSNGATQDVFAVRLGAGASLDVTDGAVSPATLPAAGGKVALSVHVTSTSVITKVIATVTPPAGAAVTVALVHGAGSLYSGAYTAAANSTFKAQTYPVSFSASNAAGQQASLAAAPLTVAGKPAGPAPVITNCRATPPHVPYEGGTLTISADVTAANGVKGVTATARGVPLTTFEGPLTHTAGNTYSGTVTITPNGVADEEPIQVSVTAVDAAGLSTTQRCPAVVQDGDGRPVITNCLVTPSQGLVSAAGGEVTVYADITAANGVSSAGADAVAGAEHVGSGILTRAAGNTFSGTIAIAKNTQETTRRITIVIEAHDEKGNTSVVNCPGFVIQNSGVPAVEECTVSPKLVSWQGGPLQITAKVSAPAGIVHVKAFATVENLGITARSMRRISHRRRWYLATIDIPPNPQRTRRSITVQVVVTDALGRKTAVSCTPNGPVIQAARRRAKR